jgi:hypothetical protein
MRFPIPDLTGNFIECAFVPLPFPIWQDQSHEGFCDLIVVIFVITI